jgi:hypothetical protein
MNPRERKVKEAVLSFGVVVAASAIWISLLTFWPSTDSRIPQPLHDPRSAPVSHRQTVTSPVPPVQVLSPTPEHKETKIYIVSKGIPSYWGISKVILGWNLDKYADFVPVNTCPSFQPCVTVKLNPKLPNTTAAETSFGYRNDITIALNPIITNSWNAQSTACHEMGHVLGLGHIKGTSKTCMTAKDGFYRALPSSLDIRLANGLGEWNLEKMYTLSGKDIDVRDAPK